MKKLLLLALLALSPLALAFTLATGDTPINTGGDGFVSPDACGFFMGVANTSNSGVVNADTVTDANQLCFDENGYAYTDANRESYVRYTRTGGSAFTMDFTWSSNSANHVHYDVTTGQWSGYAKILGTTWAENEKWVWFDWTCAAGSSCAGLDTGKYRVTTDLDTGVTSGYAWNDRFGWIRFYNDNNTLYMELAPREVQVFVDVLANDLPSTTADDLGPGDVNLGNAPFADGYQYWRVRVQFWDATRGVFLSDSDVSALTLTLNETSDSWIYLDQIIHRGNAVRETELNSFLGCSTASPKECVLTESDLSKSFSYFVKSGGPTSNMLGLSTDTDINIEYYADRAGTKWIYKDQCDLGGGPATCPISSPTKGEVFFARDYDRNKYELDTMTLDVTFSTTREIELYEYDDTASGGSGLVETCNVAGVCSYTYTFADDQANSSFRPRYRLDDFFAFYDSAENRVISDDLAEVMTINTEATVASTSAQYRAAGGAASVGYSVYYQLDADNSHTDRLVTDQLLIMDSTQPADGVEDNTYRTDTISAAGFTTTYNKTYALGYGQLSSYTSTCGQAGQASCSGSSNTLENPTAEQWVCDNITEQFYREKSCYFTAYMPIQDRHVDAEDLLVMGAINATVEAEDIISGAEGVSVLGTTDISTLRNKMYEQVTRYVLGKSAGAGTLDSSMNPSSRLVSLINGRLLYAQGDVIIDGSSSFTDKTLVVLGGNVCINGDITGGKLGIIVFAIGGIGGHGYFAPNVTDLQVNMFLDGSVFSYDGGTGSSCPSGEPSLGGATASWSDEDERTETLLNQLYIKGSIMSRNTVGGADETASSWEKGDGTTTTNWLEALDHDLNKLRQYRLCYGLDASGNIDTSVTEECNEGELLSDYVDETGAVTDYPLIIEYAPAENLPIFTAESTFFGY